jgi:hypothetical protein
MAKRRTPYPNLASPDFLEWVRRHLSTPAKRVAVLRALETELRDLGFSDDGGALLLVRVLGEPQASLTANTHAAGRSEVATRQGLLPIEREHLQSALWSLYVSDARTDLAAHWRDAKMAITGPPKRPDRARPVVIACGELEEVYADYLSDLRREVATASTRRPRLQEDERQVRTALTALREVRAVLIDNYESVHRADEWLADDERRLLIVAKALLADASSLPKALSWFGEFADTLVDTLEAEAQARKDVVGLTFLALLPITAHPNRLATALEEGRAGSKSGTDRGAREKEKRTAIWWPLFDRVRTEYPDEHRAIKLATYIFSAADEYLGTEIQKIAARQSAGQPLTNDDAKRLARLRQYAVNPPAVDTIRGWVPAYRRDRAAR